MTPTARPTALTAHTVEVDIDGADLDLVAEAGEHGFLYEDDHGGLAARGIAAVIELPRGLADPTAAEGVRAVLDGIATDDPTGPVAVAALPFDAGRPAALVVPALVIRRDGGGKARVTTIGPAGHDTAARSWHPAAPAPPSTAPDGFALHPEPGHRDWQSTIEQALAAIGRGEFTKVVLARAVRVEANRDIDRAAVLRRLRSLYPSCVTFAAGGFVGATPELLVARHGDRVRSHPLAGTVPRSGDPDHDRALAAAMLASAKEREEHALTVDAVAAALRPLCTDVEAPTAPDVVSLRNVAHLASTVTGRLRETDKGLPSALDLVARLHPTPAVGGAPTQPALDFIERHENLDRHFYAGPVGWVDGTGDGEWMVGIRSAQLDGDTARLYAGVGIVAGSDPDAELAETQFKLQALLSALVRP